jgi:Bacteriophage baseplate protein W
VQYEAKVEQSISVILETAKRERVMLPAFGAGLRSYVFESNSVQTARSVETAVQDALVTYEPRITVENVRAQASPDDPNLLLIEIDYVVRATSSFFNLVYPFYLTQRT